MLKHLFSAAPAKPALAYPLKLNLGSGYRKMDGYLNADKYADAQPDLVLDLEVLPWPFPDNCATHVNLSHVLEHVGRDSATFLAMVQELWRVCAPGAQILIRVPHPRHDNFLGDPTHVRPIMPATLQAFDQEINRDWIATGSSATPLGVMLGVDFQVMSVEYIPDAQWKKKLDAGAISVEQLFEAAGAQNNVLDELIFNWTAHKPPRAPG